ncbi:MAG TPA: hypothetical protein VFV03_07480 [Solirubrobacteraceae bacterium]|nr:hypothetical protein [Solirubrobacteraceae bacterium]
MATVAVDGTLLHVVAGGGVVVITDNPRNAGHVLPLNQAGKLGELLDIAASDEAPRGLLGSVSTVDGVLMHVVRSSCHVTLHDQPDPRAHSGWTLRMVDQVVALRDAISDAVGVSTQ